MARIVRAREKISENGNTVLAMTAKFPSGAELQFAVTFVEKASKLVGFFCRSLEIELPAEPGIEIELRPEHVLNRIFYPVIEHDENGAPRITRFIDRQAALAANPHLASVTLQPQKPLTLPIVRTPSL